MVTTSIRYDSRFEEDLHKGALSKCKFHPDKVHYKVERKYEPDFQYGNTLIESKGRFRDRTEATKYLWVRKALPVNIQLVFVLMNHKTPMPGAKVRKCGTKQTMGDWCDKHGFVWYTPRTTPKAWSK